MTDESYRGELGLKVKSSVLIIDEAFSPWQIAGKNRSDRMESLRRILFQAADAGIMLFAQPSTFTFDWLNRDRSDGRNVVVSPALIERLDETGEALRQEQVLLKAGRTRI